jgi:RNA polymerase subunit RPABC4/transcription elongation factor Spt4
MKSPHFFCENCGAEVPLDAKQCPRCGREFASVRCPACNFVGEEALFTGGCPVCGYTVASPPPKPSSGRFGGGGGALPLWVYFLTALLVLGICGALLVLR